MPTNQDRLSSVQVVRPSAPATISSATDTNFDFAVDSKSELGYKVILDVISRANGSAKIKSITLASDSGFTNDVEVYSDASDPALIMTQSKPSSATPFAGTLAAAGQIELLFSQIVKSYHKHCRVVVETIGGTVSLVAQVLVLIDKNSTPRQ